MVATLIEDKFIAELMQKAKNYFPKTKLGKLIKYSLPHLPLNLQLELLEEIKSVAVIESSLKIGRAHV